MSSFLKPTNLIIGTLLIFTITSFGQGSNSNQVNRIENSDKQNQYDFSDTAIIPFDNKGNYPFLNSYKPSILTKEELRKVDILFIRGVEEYNNSIDLRNKYLRINLNDKDYKKQLIAVFNPKGEKEVWVNCFCKSGFIDWRKEVYLVKDGGSCYFNFKVNLTQNKFLKFHVNGEA